MPAESSAQSLLLVDYFALFHRSRSALLRSLGSLNLPDGTPTTGTYGFTNNLLSVIEKVKPTHVAVVYDAGGNFRKQDENYKANRTGPDTDFKVESTNVLETVLPHLGIHTVGIYGYEADDVIYTMSRLAADFDKVTILTCDQDILQSVGGNVEVMLFNSAKKVVVMDESAVKEKLGVPPSWIPLYKAVCGDSSDNIKGIKGIGPKTAVKILEESQGVLQGVLDHPKVKPYAELVKDNLHLTQSVMVGESPTDFNLFTLGQGTFQQVDWVLDKFHFNAMKKRRKKILATLNINDGAKDAVK
jgi:DNA polymerase-1